MRWRKELDESTGDERPMIQDVDRHLAEFRKYKADHKKQDTREKIIVIDN